MSDLQVVLTVVTAVGCATAGGALFAFSSFVMKALGRLEPAEGAAAMQSINVVAVTPAFMTAVFGAAAACVATAVWAVAEWSDSYGPYLLAGSAAYLAGVIATTMGYNVPRNNVLAALDPATPEAQAYWQRYLREWTAANHVRAAAGIAAAAALTVGLDLS